MSEEAPLPEKNPVGVTSRYAFLFMIGGAVAIAVFLVSVALALYASSGAAQLDLSRPGYQSVREQAGKIDTFDGFSADGPIDSEALTQFRTLYDDRARRVSGDSFGGSVMNDDSLSIDAPTQ